MRVFSTVFTMVALTLVASSWAQDYNNFPGVWSGWGGYHHASTAEEGMARGMADFTRSAGMANLMNSEAAINYQDAQKKYLENRVYGTDAYFDMRKMNREAREAERGPRPTQDDLIRYAKARAPSKLSVSDFDPFSGQISWPPLLRDDTFAADRQALENLFGQRASAGQLSASQRAEVRQAAQDMQQTLKSNINLYSPQDYVQAKQFIESLSYELYAQAG